MKLLLDECLSPRLARELCEGGYEAAHPRDTGGLGDLDHVVLARCIREDRTLVTHNAGDFRRLVGREELHPGLIILEDANRDTTRRMIEAALAHIHAVAGAATAGNHMINRVIEVSRELEVTTYILPPI